MTESIPTQAPTRLCRSVAWVVLLALASYQAYAQRYAVSPDGISYLDLSDAIVTGNWSRLVNLYWSPLYPVLIGTGRLLVGTGPAAEIPIVHAVNLICFVAMLAAFDYMLMSILSLTTGTKRAVLATPIGVAGAYALFGCFALTMIPLELTTPDLLNATAMMMTFGAMLRLHRGSSHRWRDAVVLGVSLGVAALTKSFMVPWAAVCFAVMGVALWRRTLQPVAVALVLWLAFVLPWSALLSRAAGRPTFGETGRLTYAWYVNGQNAPSLGGVPIGTRQAATEAILPGVGVAADTAGSDPMWFDPAKWNRAASPQLRLGDQLRALEVSLRFCVQDLAPLLFLFLLLCVAPRGSRRLAWQRGWVIYVPAIVGFVAYALVIVTMRYVILFVLAGMLTMFATLPIPRRLAPLLFLFGLAIPIALESLEPQTIRSLSLVTSIVGGMLIGAVTSTRRRIVWVVAVGLGLGLTRVLLSPVFPDLLRFGAIALAVILWRLSLVAVRNWRTLRFATTIQASLAILIAAILFLRLGIRFTQDAAAAGHAASQQWGNVPLNIARELHARGIAPGAQIALIGPHAESYWARSGRMHIVANVPRPRVEAFWTLSRQGQDSLLAAFAAAGATVAIASVGPETGAPDASWTPIRYHGWIRALPLAR